MNHLANPFAATGLGPDIAEVGRQQTDISFDTELVHNAKNGNYEGTLSVSQRELANAFGVRDIDQTNINGFTVNHLSSSSNCPIVGHITQGGSNTTEPEREMSGIVDRAFHVDKRGSLTGHFTTPGSGTFSKHIPVYEPAENAANAGAAPAEVKEEDTHRRWMNYQNKGVDKIDHDSEPVYDPSGPPGAPPIAHLLPFRQGGVPKHDDGAITTALHHNADKDWLGGKYTKEKMDPSHPDTCLVTDTDSESGYKIAVDADQFNNLKEEFVTFLTPKEKNLNVVLTSTKPTNAVGAITIHSGPRKPNPCVTVNQVSDKFNIPMERFTAAQSAETAQITPTSDKAARLTSIAGQYLARNKPKP